MKIVTLMENTACREDCAVEHGLSLYIETGKHRILFDFGPSAAFMDNAQKLGIDLSQVDFAVLSHGHYDHGGGLEAFLEINHSAPVYVNQNAFLSCYHGPEKYIGLNPALKGHPRLILVEDSREIAEGITLHSCNNRPQPFPADSYGLQVLENDKLIADDFRHEQYLLVEEVGKIVCISGCSHKGILNIAHWFQPDVLVGGFHFMKVDPIKDSAFLEDAARQLLLYPTTYYTGHCTGTEQFAVLKQTMGARLESISTGKILEL